MENGQLGEMQVKLWAMEARALEAFMRSFARLEMEPDRYMEAALQSPRPRKSRMVMDGTTAVIPITGYLMKSPPAWALRYFDITGYEEVIADIKAAANDAGVTQILLHVNSPGGEVAGAQEAADAIYQARKVKPVNGFIEDLGASGAYYLASQAKELGTNLNGLVGSIGVYAVYMDRSKMAEDLGIKVHVIRSGEHKGMGIPGAPITEKQLSGIQGVIDDMAANFRAAVSRGRGLAASKVEKLATGQVWLGEKSRELGLVDSVTTIEAMLTGNADSIVRVLSGEAGIMAEENEKKDQDDKVKVVVFDEEAMKVEAAANATKAEKERLAALKAEFPEDLAFAIEQYEAGATVQEAKASYAGVLREKLKASEKEKTELAEKLKVATTPLQGASGAEPVGFGESTEGETDFVKAAIALSQEKGITKTAAMRQLAKENPEMHLAWKASLNKVRRT